MDWLLGLSCAGEWLGTCLRRHRPLGRAFLERSAVLNVHDVYAKQNQDASLLDAKGICLLSPQTY